MRAGSLRGLVALPIAAACAVAIGGAVLWLYPPHSVWRTGPSVPVAGAPGEFRPGPAPAFSLVVLSAGTVPVPSSTGGIALAPLIPPAGGRLALAALRGHPVVINFWASWCAPCRAEMPMLVRAWHAYAPRGVVVLGLDTDDTPAEARRFLAAYHVDYPIVTVPDDRLGRAYGVIGLPTTVFVDASGAIRARQLGQFAGPDGERTLTRQLDALLAAERR